MEENIVFFNERLQDHIPFNYRKNYIQKYPQIDKPVEDYLTPLLDLTIDFYYPFAFQWFTPHYLGEYARTYIPLPVRLFYQFETYSLKVMGKYVSKLEFKSDEQLTELEHHMKVYFNLFQNDIFHKSAQHSTQDESFSQESNISIEYPEPRFRVNPYKLLFIYNKPIEKVCLLGTCCGCKNWGTDGYILSIDDCSISPVHQLRRDDMCCYVGIDFLMSNGISTNRSDIIGEKFLIYGRVSYSDYDQEIGINVDSITIVASMRQEFEHYNLMEEIAEKLINGEPWFLPRATKNQESQNLEKIVYTFPQYLQSIFDEERARGKEEHGLVEDEQRSKAVIDQRAWLQQELEMTHLNVFQKVGTSVTESESLKTDKMYLGSSLPKHIDQSLYHNAFSHINSQIHEVDFSQVSEHNFSSRFLNDRSHADDEEVDLLEGFDIFSSANETSNLRTPTGKAQANDLVMNKDIADANAANENISKANLAIEPDSSNQTETVEAHEIEKSLNIGKTSLLSPPKKGSMTPKPLIVPKNTTSQLQHSIEKRIITSSPAISLPANEASRSSATPKEDQDTTLTLDEMYRDYKAEFMNQFMKISLDNRHDVLHNNSFHYSVPALSVKLGNFANAITKKSFERNLEIFLHDQESLKKNYKAMYENNKLVVAQKVSKEFAKENPLVFHTQEGGDLVSLSNERKILVYLIDKIQKMIALRLSNFKITFDLTFCRNIEGLKMVEQDSSLLVNDVGLSMEFIDKMLHYVMKHNSSVRNGTVKKWMITSQGNFFEFCIKCSY